MKDNLMLIALIAGAIIGWCIGGMRDQLEKERIEQAVERICPK